MKKLFVILAIIAVAVVTAVSCEKQKTPEEIKIDAVKSAIVGNWSGTLPLGQKVLVMVSKDFEITTDGNFSAQITAWTYKSGSVWAELNTGASMAIEITGITMKISSNDLAIYAALPTELSKLLLQ